MYINQPTTGYGLADELYTVGLYRCH